MKNINLIVITCFLASALFASNPEVKVLAKENCNGVATCDANSSHFVDIYIQNSDANLPVYLFDQNYRFSYNVLAINPLCINYANSDLKFGTPVTSNGGNNTSFFNNPTLVGSIPGIVSLNIEAVFDLDGYLLSSTSLTYIATVEFEVLDATQSIDFVWHDDIIHPFTFISTNDGSLYTEVPVTSYDGIDVSFSNLPAGMKANVEPRDTYTYLWNGGDTGSIKNGACPDEDHTVTITDSNGCSETFTYTSGSGSTGGGGVDPEGGPIGIPREAYNPCGGGVFGGGVIILQDVNDDLVVGGGLGDAVNPIFTGLSGGKLGVEFNNIEVYPNPANSILHVNLKEVEYDNGKLKLFSVAGREVISKNVNADTEKTSIDVSQINNGIYLLKIYIDGKETHTQKLTIAH